MTSTRTKAPAEKPMPARTLKALKGSIAKWEKIVKGDMVDLGTDNCPLCDLFWSPDLKCLGCPVSAKVGVGGCVGSPYMPWLQLFPWGESKRVKTKKQREAAREELAFLKSLLPRRSRT